VNRGISGDTTRGLLFRVKQDVLDLQPKAVVVLVGINDLDCGSTPDDVFQNLKEIAGLIPVPVIICNIPPRLPLPGKFPEEIIELNTMITESFERACDMYTPLTVDGQFHQGSFEDAVHPNRAGYKLMASILRPVVTRIARP
jgi:lysophospholipase L1-like esterase